MSRTDIKTKRIYEDPSQYDGYRVLIDRLDEWLKKVAPSTELRKWFDHDPDKFNEFSRRYKGELTQKEEVVEYLLKIAEEQKVTLLYAAKDKMHNHAIVLKEFLDSYGKKSQ